MKYLLNSACVSVAEAMAGETLGDLLADVPLRLRHELALEHLGSCAVGGHAGARAREMLKGLCGTAAVLRAACRKAGIDPAPGRRDQPKETMQSLLRAKFLTILPPVAFNALVDLYARAAEHDFLRDRRVDRDEVRQVAAAWGISRRIGTKNKTTDALRDDLCAALIVLVRYIDPEQTMVDGPHIAAAREGPSASAPSAPEGNAHQMHDMTGDGTNIAAARAVSSAAAYVAEATMDVQPTPFHALLKAASEEVQRQYAHLGSCVIPGPEQLRKLVQEKLLALIPQAESEAAAAEAPSAPEGTAHQTHDMTVEGTALRIRY
eukprot:s3603_g3.t1